MTGIGKFVYPRLSDGIGLHRLLEMKTAGSYGTIQLMVAYEHEDAAPVPTGGTPAKPVMLQEIRESVIDTVSLTADLKNGIVKRKAEFDRALGQALYSQLKIVRSDAAYPEVWTFLSTVVFPDLVYARFPDLNQDRVLGRPRNTLRRVWEREAAIGDLQSEASNPLGEDELVGVFERTAVSRNSRLIRAVVRHILRYEGKRRSEYVRALMLEVTKLTGPYLLDVVSDEVLDSLIQEAGAKAIKRSQTS